MKNQLILIHTEDSPRRPWELDAVTRAVGRRGVRQARLTLHKMLAGSGQSGGDRAATAAGSGHDAVRPPRPLVVVDPFGTPDPDGGGGARSQPAEANNDNLADAA